MALFSPASNSIFSAVLAVAAVTLVGVPLALWLYVRTPYNTGLGQEVTQPVVFDHRHHVGDDGIDCRYCHYTVERSPYAGVPPTALCMNCHGQIWNASVLLTPVRESYFNDTPIVWNRVSSVPDFVFFNHAIHVQRGVGCVSCHGRVDQMASVYKTEPMTMEWCLACHEDPAPNLRPQELITDLTWVADDPRALGERIMKDRNIRPATDCSACHR